MSQDPAVEQIRGIASQSEEGDSITTGKNMQLRNPSLGLDITVLNTADRGQKGSNGTQMEGGVLPAMARIPQILH